MHTRAALDVELESLAAEMPALCQDMDAFFDAFEQRSEQIWVAAAPKDQAYVLEALEAIIARAGINA